MLRYVEHDTLIWDYLNSSIHLAPYLEEKFRKIYAGDAYKFYRQSDKVSLNILIFETHRDDFWCELR